MTKNKKIRTPKDKQSEAITPSDDLSVVSSIKNIEDILSGKSDDDKNNISKIVVGTSDLNLKVSRIINEVVRISSRQVVSSNNKAAAEPSTTTMYPDAVLSIIVSGIDTGSIASLHEIFDIITNSGVKLEEGSKSFKKTVTALESILKIISSSGISNIEFDKSSLVKLDNVLRSVESSVVSVKNISHNGSAFSKRYEKTLTNFNSFIKTILFGTPDTPGILVIESTIDKKYRSAVGIRNLLDVIDKYSKLIIGLVDVSYISAIMPKNADKHLNVVLPVFKRIIEELGKISPQVSKINFSAYSDISSGLFKLSSSLVVISALGPVAMLANKALPHVMNTLLNLGRLRRTTKVVVGDSNGKHDNKTNNQISMQISDMGKTILAIGGTMLVVALFADVLLKKWQVILGFFAITGAFIGLVAGLTNVFSSKVKGSEAVFKDISILLATVTGLLLFASFIPINQTMIGNMVTFVVAIGVFLIVIISAITLPLVWLKRSNGLNIAIAGANDIIKLLVAITGILLVGSFFMNGDILTKSLGFAAAVSTFLVIISGSISLMTKFGGANVTKSLKNLTILIVSLGAVIAFGTVFSARYSFLEMLAFPAAAIIFLGAIAGIVLILGKLSGGLKNSILPLILVGVISGLIAVVMYGFAKCCEIIRGAGGKSVWSDIFAVVTGAITIIVGIAVIAGILGAIASTGIGAVGLTVCLGILGGIVAIAIALGESMKSISTGFLSLKDTASKIKDTDKVVEQIDKLFSAITTITSKLTKLNIKPRIVKRNTKAINAVIGTIGNAASVINDVASMRVPIEFDSNGKPIKWSVISDSELKQAIINTKIILTTLASGILEAYNTGIDGDTNIFKADSTTLVKMSYAIGSIVSMIGSNLSTIEDLVDFKVTYIDDNGVKKNVKFDNAKAQTAVKNNIRTIFTCLADALIELQKSDGLFSTSIWDKVRNIKPINAEIFDIIVSGADTIKRANEVFVAIQNPKAFGDAYSTVFKTIFETFSTDEVKQGAKQISELKTTGITELVTTINKIDNNKVDKFIELSNSISSLSENMDDLNMFVDKINGKLTTTLTVLSDSISKASNTIIESEKSQDARQKKVEEHTKVLKDMFETPLNVQLTTSTSKSMNTNSKSAPNSSGTNATPDPVFSTSTSTSINELSDSTMISISGTISDIYALLQQYLNK